MNSVKRRVVSMVASTIMIVLVVEPWPGIAHPSGQDNPVFQQLTANNGVTFDNPKLLVAGSSAYFDISWSPCNVDWAEYVTIRIRGLDSAGTPATVWKTLDTVNYSSYPTCSWPQPLHKSVSVSPETASAPIHEIEFLGTSTGRVFIRAWDRTIEQAEALNGVPCRGTAVTHGTETSSCTFRGRNGLVAYDNPNFSVIDQRVSLDINFDPCDRVWPEGVAVYIRRVGVDGAPSTPWKVLTAFDYGALSCTDWGFDLRARPFHRHGVPLPSGLSGQPYYVLEFRGASTGETFIRAKAYWLPYIDEVDGLSPLESAQFQEILDENECARTAVAVFQQCVREQMLNVSISNVISVRWCFDDVSDLVLEICIPYFFALPSNPPELPDEDDPSVPPDEDWLPPVAQGEESWYWVGEEGTHSGWPTPDGKFRRPCLGVDAFEYLHWDGLHALPKGPHWAYKDCEGNLWERPFAWTTYGNSWRNDRWWE